MTVEKNDNKTTRRPLNGVKFKPGNPGGPGRPRKENCFSDIAREMLASEKIDIKIGMGNGKESRILLTASRSFRHGLIASMIIEGLKGNIQAAKELMDRTDGKVADRMELSAATGIDAMTEEEAQAELNAIQYRETKVKAGKDKAIEASADELP